MVGAIVISLCIGVCFGALFSLKWRNHNGVCNICQGKMDRNQPIIVRSDLIEKVSAIEHDQWRVWASQVQGEVSPARKERWQKFMIPYAQLDEATKELDRDWARKVVDCFPCQGEIYCQDEK